MPARISGFRISGLHGQRDVSISIEDNCIVLVGVNGLGKTTIINLLYSLLTRQWSRLVEHQFEALAIDVNGRTFSISRAVIEAPLHSKKWRARLARFSPRVASMLSTWPEIVGMLASAPHDPFLLRRLSDEFGIPKSVLMELRSIMEDEPVQRELFASGTEVQQFEEELRKEDLGQVLYLPTYRRIERDLEKLFPGLEDQLHRHRAPRAARESAFLEFVEFGMRDVEERFGELLNRLKERARIELNNLAASYLGEVVRGEAATYDTRLIASLEDDDIDRILNRVEERNILNARDKDTLGKVITRLKLGGVEEISVQEKYVGHFFSKLTTIHKSLSQAEGAVGAFVEVCNRYLVGKSIAFDDRKYSIGITQSETDAPLELRHLSSGEKQIVSLFTHIYLGDAPDLLVLIDEPELSLSVPWQKQLLPDIRASGRCSFLAAVTHSPFIYDNELRSRAVDLRQCINPRRAMP